ncbi:sugar phosphate isomerase/epimerase family protein [Tundrisphaera sp. TA3]|uniref:sugar phosphate isomerase/epimerase family protein n=1 Tax=Tundrisphaera sp. TA3 TaxID=3435775 RepID=UPI003EBB2F75
MERPDPIALQLWTIREALAADPDRALARVRSVGFSAIEIAPPPEGLSTGRILEALADHGLSVVSIHGDLPTPENIGRWAEVARACRCPKIIWHGWPRDPRFDSPEGVGDLISAYNAAGALARDHGLQFGIHNHWWEFEPVGGVRPIRRLDAELHPGIFFQLDVYWAQAAGFDPAGVLLDLMPRVRSLHLKDGPAVHGEPMTAPGTGAVDFRRILGALQRPVDWIIELDECASDPLDAARQGLIYLEGLQDETRP